MADITTPDLLPGISGSVIKKRLVDMGDGTFAEMTVTTLAASANSVGTVNIGSLGGAATATNQTLGNSALTAIQEALIAPLPLPNGAAKETGGNLAAIASPYVATTATAIAATVSDTAAHTYGPFTPQLAREIWLTLNATAAASGTARLLRSTDGGATKVGLTAGGVAIGAYTFSAITGAIVNEIVSVETDAAATYYLSITLSAGTVAVRVAQ